MRLINRDRVSLQNCWFINMDEYLDEDGNWIPKESPLSFRGFMERTVYTKIDPQLLMAPEQRAFPDPKEPGKVDKLIQELGGWILPLAASASTGILPSTRPGRT